MPPLKENELLFVNCHARDFYLSYCVHVTTAASVTFCNAFGGSNGMVGTWHGDVAEGDAALRARENVRARSRAQVDTLTYGVFHLGLHFIFLSHIQTGDCSFAVKRVLRGGGGVAHMGASALSSLKDGLDPETLLSHQTDFFRTSN